VKIKNWLKLGGDTPIAEAGLVGKFMVCAEQRAVQEG
jgi:hypothetical protein